MKYRWLSFLVFLSAAIHSQSSFTFRIYSVNASCNGGKDGEARVSVQGGGSYTYHWSTGDTSAAINRLSSGSYTVTITDSTGRDTSATANIQENLCEIKMQLAFSPNGDGINDEWEIGNIEYYPDFLLLIYNRWGQKVYEQQKEYRKWDGKNGNLPLPDAAYYYILYKNQDNEEEGILKGSVSILR